MSTWWRGNGKEIVLVWDGGRGAEEGGWYLPREEYPAFPLGFLSRVLKRKGRYILVLLRGLLGMGAGGKELGSCLWGLFLDQTRGWELPASEARFRFERRPSPCSRRRPGPEPGPG